MTDDGPASCVHWMHTCTYTMHCTLRGQTEPQRGRNAVSVISPPATSETAAAAGTQAESAGSAFAEFSHAAGVRARLPAFTAGTPPTHTLTLL